ncbi:hypothetical protein WICPIJ_000079 [Wickerhamomyces pijperi]|uniref:Uncharacterized protein n=1 Tax=Wickerhamomyces pijperi TaxID=599730 RepID=A0A9P8TSI0_WICPI|nr:hypothetical protein WICPIJ_000079 [Wickerhamomyces pijperi]
MEIAPEINSANPPVITNLVSPKELNPAVKAKGTVNPSLNPMTMSDITLGSTLPSTLLTKEVKSVIGMDSSSSSSSSLLLLDLAIEPIERSSSFKLLL